MAMMKIKAFLDWLEADPNRLERFEKEPLAVMKGRLTPEQQLAVLGGTVKDLRDAMAAEGDSVMVIRARMT